MPLRANSIWSEVEGHGEGSFVGGVAELVLVSHEAWDV